MDLRDVQRLGRSLLDQHGLRSWAFGLDNAKRRAGICKFQSRTISVSRHLMSLYDEGRVRETILHEIAHALVGPKHGHDRVWRAQAIAIGCSGERVVDREAPSAPAPWVGTCPGGHTLGRYKRPTRVTSCAVCSGGGFSVDHILRWTFHGRQVSPGAAYERELLATMARHRPAVPVPVGVHAGRSTVAGNRTAAPTLWDSDDDPTGFGNADPVRGVLGKQGPVGVGLGNEGPIGGGPVGAGKDDDADRRAMRSLAAKGWLPPGWPVRVAAPGRWDGVKGVVIKSARTRYHLRVGRGRTLTVPFRLVEPLEPGR